jgi:hypothetical protein
MDRLLTLAVTADRMYEQDLELALGPARSWGLCVKDPDYAIGPDVHWTQPDAAVLNHLRSAVREAAEQCVGLFANLIRHVSRALDVPSEVGSVAQRLWCIARGPFVVRDLDVQVAARRLEAEFGSRVAGEATRLVPLCGDTLTALGALSVLGAIRGALSRPLDAHELSSVLPEFTMPGHDFQRDEFDAMAVVRLGTTENMPDSARALAARRLNEAVWNRPGAVVTWLRACARLEARESEPTVLRLLRSDHAASDLWIAALDAVRVVLHSNEHRHSTADVLLGHAARLVASDRVLASYTLRTAVSVGAAANVGALGTVFRTWPLELLGAPLRELSEVVRRRPLNERVRIPGVGVLADAATDLERTCRARGVELEESHSALLELLVLLTAPSALPDSVDLLCEVYRGSDRASRAAAAAATKVLVQEQFSAFFVFRDRLEGQEILEAADALSRRRDRQDGAS